MSATPFLKWFVALHHSTNTGDGARHVETVERWLCQNAQAYRRGIQDDWVVVGIAPTNSEASEILDRYQNQTQN